MAFRHGKLGALLAGSFACKILSWAVEDAVDLDDSTNTSSGGHKERTAGCDGIDFTIEAQWDAAAGPYNATGPNMTPGSILSTVNMSVDGTTTNAYNCASTIIEKASIKMVVKNTITWTITGHSQGAFTRPTL